MKILFPLNGPTQIKKPHGKFRRNPGAFLIRIKFKDDLKIEISMLQFKPIRSDKVDIRPEKIYIGRSEAGNSKNLWPSSKDFTV